jgi:hypothetical protein
VIRTPKNAAATTTTNGWSGNTHEAGALEQEQEKKEGETRNERPMGGIGKRYLLVQMATTTTTTTTTQEKISQRIVQSWRWGLDGLEGGRGSFQWLAGHFFSFFFFFFLFIPRNMLEHSKGIVQ